MLLNRERAEGIMRERGLDALIATTPENVIYASNDDSDRLFFFLNMQAATVLPRDGLEPCLIVPGTELPYLAGEPSWIQDVRAFGWTVIGTDLSWSMLCAAIKRERNDRVDDRLHLVLAPMENIPAKDRSFDLVIAHGIWNLARSAAQFRQALAEAARVARPGAGLFVFTFSRNTFPPQTEPVAGEPFVFTQFSGEPQCFLSEAQLVAELGRVCFALDPSLPLREYNRPQPGALAAGTMPVIYEAAFRRES